MTTKTPLWRWIALAGGLCAVSVTGTGNPTSLKLSITSPSAGFRVYNTDPVIELQGQASDKAGVFITNLQYYVNGDTTNSLEIDQEGLPANPVAWTASVDLSQVGRIDNNVVTVLAYDSAGNHVSVSRTFAWIYTNTAVVSVNPIMAGKVEGIRNGQTLQVSNGYSVTAVPANTNWIFSTWTDSLGDILSSNVTFEYYDTSLAPTTTLTGNFETNRFCDTNLVGTYAGLFYNATNIQPDDAGYITMTVTTQGSYSGRLDLPASSTSYSFSSQLAEAANDTLAGVNFNIEATSNLDFSKPELLNVSLLVATDTNLSNPGAGMLGGFVNASTTNAAQTNQLGLAQIQGELCLNNTNTTNGIYNVYIPSSYSDLSQGPGGYGYGVVTVRTNGPATVLLNLPDGTSSAVSCTSFVSPDGTCPFMFNLYGGQGVILGWLQFATDRSGKVLPPSNSGKVLPPTKNWIKPAVADQYYTNGFTNTPIITGGLYLPPTLSSNVFGKGESALTFEINRGYSGLSLPDEVDVSVTYNPTNNSFVPEAPNTNRLTINLNRVTGVLSGSFWVVLAPRDTVRFTFFGVMANGAGYGFYTDTVNKGTGPIWIGVPASDTIGEGGGVTAQEHP